MNIAFFMRPKAEVAFLYEDFTVRQALEKMKYHGYSAIPVLSRAGKYVGTISEGDLLWFIINGEDGSIAIPSEEKLETIRINEIGCCEKNNKDLPVKITSSIDELLMMAMNRNFIPIVDDRDMFIGIVTRREVIRYFYENKLDLYENDNKEGGT